MIPSAYDLKEFYARKTGRMIRRILRAQILSLWPDTKGQRMLACGYALPYMRPYLKEAERVIIQLPPRMDAHAWPPEGKNLVVLSATESLPIETNSIDRLLVMHGLEFTDNPAETFVEYWRVLKSSGRMIVIVPNRMGLWSRVDWTPFGHGTPFSATQIHSFLRDQGFVIEQTKGALFVPPLGRGFLLNAADPFETLGQFLFSGFGGLHVIEVSKQVYALTGKGHKVRAKAQPAMVTQAQSSPRSLRY